ncbi:MAG: UDP-N-acetylglucosamine--N-acetylmuramyl-(pentapeptide) pyrophosphoryl-undecaprenol N-acetylglucosamine transferase [Candidatus Omnitrophica bacterium]|nr:UDP-N-acetylglucosamine--N-acetylmuramyl-(pentapeptide) pyrophosphoryl-undecaprenol N-acetylglucosamine transferase [Candidatus Omnitrophota bacterium]
MRVLVAAGSSGGHIFPALSFIRAIKDKDVGISTLLVLPKRCIGLYSLPDGSRIRYICGSNLTLKIAPKSLISLFEFLKGVAQSLSIIIEYRPDIVAGFGSLDSIAIVLFGWFFRIKTIVHEQNVIPGRANRLLARFVDKVAVSFTDTGDYLNIDKQKVAFTGNPLRKELVKIERLKALEFFGLTQDKFTILVAGGSQGSGHVNSVFSDTLLSSPDLAKCQVIHISGNKDYADLKEKYRCLDSRVTLFSFFDKMHYAYSASDLVVCRAGATTIAELLYFNLPAIFIPYPYAYAHQYNNAQVVASLGKAKIVSDAELSVDKLRQALLECISSQGKSGIMHVSQVKVNQENAADSLANLVLSLI